MAPPVTAPRVPFLDLQPAHEELREPLEAAITRVVGRGRFVLGPELEAFEQAFARFVGTRHCVGVANGLDALTLSLQALGVGAGDEVVVPGNTFVATWLAVDRIGATPVPVDPDPRTHTIDPGQVAAALTPRTRAIVPVHLYGLPAAMTELEELATEHGVHLLEDAAQAHGARHHGRRVGSFGSAAAWSFYPAKNLGALGDAGAVTTDDDAVAERLRLLRNYGSVEKYRHVVAGVNSRLDDLQAAVLSVKLDVLDEWNDRRRAVAARYLRELAGTALVLPVVPDGLTHAWHLFVVRSERRDELLHGLALAGVEAAIHYPVAPHAQPAYARLGLSGASLPVSERLQHEVLSLPIGPHLSEGQVTHVIESVRSLDG